MGVMSLSTQTAKAQPFIRSAARPQPFINCSLFLERFGWDSIVKNIRQWRIIAKIARLPTTVPFIITRRLPCQPFINCSLFQERFGWDSIVRNIRQWRIIAKYGIPQIWTAIQIVADAGAGLGEFVKLLESCWSVWHGSISFLVVVNHSVRKFITLWGGKSIVFELFFHIPKINETASERRKHFAQAQMTRALPRWFRRHFQIPASAH